MDVAPSANEHRSVAPRWAEWMGVIAVILGAYLTASQGVHLTKQYVFALPIGQAERAQNLECPEDELREEGITLEVCRQMQADIEATLITTPRWFLRAQIGLGIAGIILAAGSLITGMALVDWRAWAPGAFITVMAGLIALELAGFIVSANSGPMIRKAYLWDYLLWLAIHISLMTGVLAAWTGGREDTE
ncbi:MAG: hypothetical protein GWO03_01820 [Gammaproteobacteria bacterium]|nr:hypothetical protein [Gammaproteobacteria bacterium]